METIGVVGCGLMGSGIAAVAALSGMKVKVVEQNSDFLAAGMKRVEQQMERLWRSRQAKASGEGSSSVPDLEAARSNLQGFTNLDDLEGCTVIIEAVTENLEIKKEIFQSLDSKHPAEVILASNTSTIPIVHLAAAATRFPSRVMGLHFFNPVPVMPLVEVIPALQTSEDITQRGVRLVEAMGKKPVIVRDRPGFIVNALLIPFLNNAVRMLEAGVATKEDIDAGVKLGLNHPMGPFELLDYIGIDTYVHAANILFEEFRDPQYAPPVLARQMVIAGYYGRKSGRGFYNYD